MCRTDYLERSNNDMPDIDDIWDDDEDMEMLSPSFINRSPDFKFNLSSDEAQRASELRMANFMAEAVRKVTDFMHKNPTLPLNIVIEGNVVHTIPPLTEE